MPFVSRKAALSIIGQKSAILFSVSLKRERAGSYALYELTCSPLTSGARTNDDEKDNPLRVPGTLVMGARNFCTVDVTGPRAARTLVFRAFAADGRELWTHQVRGDTLRPPAN